jgi:threonine dehydrogenase-like Zn-dependent dehydrogenase
VSYLADSFLGELVSHVLPFKAAAEAYRVIDQQPAEVVQVVLDYKQ